MSVHPARISNNKNKNSSGGGAILLFQLLLLILTCSCGMASSSSPSQSQPPVQDIPSIRSLLIGGALPARYMGRMASFGNPLDGSGVNGNDMTRTYNLVLPPDDPWLCEYPASLKSLTQNETDTIRMNQLTLYPEPVALLVSINSCSAETKARVALQIQQTLAIQLKVLIVYSPDPANNQVIQLHPDFPGSNTDDLNSIGIMHIPYKYAAGIETRMRMTWNGEDPRFLQGDNNLWEFPIILTNYTGISDDDHYTNGQGGSGNSNNNNSSNIDSGAGGDMYWFRIILFSILVLSPCCRACYLWYAGGGRFYFRRNEQGWIVGLQYVPPAPAWLATGRHPATPTGARRAGTLSEEQFNALPEIEYQPIASHYDEDKPHKQDVDDDTNDSNKPKPTAPSDTTKQITDNDGGDIYVAAASETVQDAPFLEEEEEKDKLEHMEQGKQEIATPTKKQETKRDPPAEHANVSNNKMAIPLFKYVPPSSEEEGEDSLEQAEEGGVLSLVCKSSMCSICIDEFEANEKIILLPKCQHGFHRDCIHPWLTERQGCCPFCKAPVLSTDDATDDEENSEALVENEAGRTTAAATSNVATTTTPRTPSGAVLAGEGRPNTTNEPPTTSSGAVTAEEGQPTAAAQPEAGTAPPTRPEQPRRNGFFTRRS